MFHSAGRPSRSLWSAARKSKQPARLNLLRHGGLPFSLPSKAKGLARQDSNLGPRDYESPALTAELQALRAEKRKANIKRPTSNVKEGSRELDLKCRITDWEPKN